jgi:hypothetical protein
VSTRVGLFDEFASVRVDCQQGWPTPRARACRRRADRLRRTACFSLRYADRRE